MDPTKLKHRRQAYILGLAALLLVSLAPSRPEPAPLQIIGLNKRDYQSNVRSTDSAWFYKNTDGTAQNPLVGDGYYNDLEYQLGRSFQIDKVTYVKSSDIEVELEFINPGFVGHDITLYVNDARLAIPPGGGETEWAYISLSDDGPYEMSLAAFGGTDSALVTLSSLPAYVARGYLQVDLEAIENENTIWTTSGWVNWENVYVPNSTPTGLQTIPWTDLLAFSCTWARGADTATEVRELVTRGMFWSDIWNYDPAFATFWEDPVESEGEVIYRLSGAVSTFDVMDCRDGSGFNVLACQSLGVALTAQRLFEDESNQFRTNLLCGMGSDATQSENYEQFNFNYHQVGTSSSYVFDSVAAHLIDLSGNDFKEPPTGWVLGEYWQTENGSGGFWGLVYGWPSPPTVAEVTLRAVTKDIDAIE